MIYIYSCDQRKHYLKRRKLKNVDVKRPKVQNTFYALAPHITVLGSLSL